MRIYDFQEYQRRHRAAGEFGWTMREYKEVVGAIDSLFDDLDFKSDTEPSPGDTTLKPTAEHKDRLANEDGDSASGT